MRESGEEENCEGMRDATHDAKNTSIINLSFRAKLCVYHQMISIEFNVLYEEFSVYDQLPFINHSYANSNQKR